MAEFKNFMDTLDGKSEFTKKTYIIQYNKLRKMLGVDIADVSQKKLIEIISQQSNPNQQQSSINIAVLVRRLNKLPTKDLEAKREANKKEVVKQVKRVNETLVLPTLNDLEEYLEYLYANNQWTDYIINYLLLEYQVRNKDLNFTITTRKKDMTDQNKNYMWLDVRQKKALYVRRDYKTEKTYGEKRHLITDKEFIVALKRVLACQKHNEDCGVFIPNENQVGYYIMRATYKGIGEGAYLKILINAHKNGGNIQKLREISYNRGTDLNTLLSNYNIELK
jgi:hypothetical protein